MERRSRMQGRVVFIMKSVYYWLDKGILVNMFEGFIHEESSFRQIYMS